MELYNHWQLTTQGKLFFLQQHNKQNTQKYKTTIKRYITRNIYIFSDRCFFSVLFLWLPFFLWLFFCPGSTRTTLLCCRHKQPTRSKQQQICVHQASVGRVVVTIDFTQKNIFRYIKIMKKNWNKTKKIVKIHKQSPRTNV